MPRQREVKPWTIYPPTQEDREIIEQKAAEASLSVSAYLCLVGKLANIAVTLPTTQKLLSEQGSTLISSEPVPEQKKPKYTLHTNWGKRLTPEQVAFVEGEIAGGRTAVVGEAENGSGGVQFTCETDGNIYEKRPVKEV